MSARTFRFGVVATPRGGTQWLGLARRVADLGYGSLLMPDGMQLPAPMPALAMAAAVTPLRVGTWVLAAPLRPVAATAWEAHSMTVLTEGRFELGIGTGRPVVAEWTAQLGLPFGSASERLGQVRRVVDRLRELDSDGPRTPVLVAAGGPSARTVAAECADTVSLAIGALTTRDDAAAMIDDVRAKAGARADDIEFATSLFVVGEEMPPHAARYIGADLAAMRAVDSLAHLSGSPREMADELLRRRDRFGTSYVTVNAEFVEQLAPVVDMLTGS